MTETVDPIEEEALAWLIRLKTAEAADWDAFAVWTAGDPARAEAYWRLAAADAELGEALTAMPAGQREAEVVAFPVRRRSVATSRWWMLAASILIVALGYGAMTRLPWLRAAQPYAIETAAGQTRDLTLGDGTRIALNGSTRLLLDHADPRHVRIERGEALFSVAHDARHPFAVQAGEARLQDLGTRFDVVRDGTGLRVAVAEGAVRFEQAGTVRDLHAGDALSVTPGQQAMTARVEPGDVASWTQRRLVYDGAALASVAADLSRSTGVAVTVAPAIAARPFSGSIRLNTDGYDTIARAAEILDVRAIRRGGGWMLADAPSPTR